MQAEVALVRGLHSTAAPLPLRQADLSAMSEVTGVRAIAGGVTIVMQRSPYCAEPSLCCPQPGCFEQGTDWSCIGFISAYRGVHKHRHEPAYGWMLPQSTTRP